LPGSVLDSEPIEANVESTSAARDDSRPERDDVEGVETVCWRDVLERES